MWFAERILNKPWLDKGDAIAKAVLGARPPVVRLVRMQDDGLATRAVHRRTAVIKGLHALKG